MITACERQRRSLPALLMACLLTAAALTTASVASAQGDKPWEVRGKVFGEPKNPDGVDAKKSEDVSGLACATTSGFPRICLIVDDESQGAQIVILNERRTDRRPIHSPDQRCA